jgi:hypothetical protein
MCACIFVRVCSCVLICNVNVCMHTCTCAPFPCTTLIKVDHKTRGSPTSPSSPLRPHIPFLQSKDVEYDARFCTYRGVRWPRAMLKFMVEEVGIPSSRITYLAGGSFAPFRSKIQVALRHPGRAAQAPWDRKYKCRVLLAAASRQRSRSSPRKANDLILLFSASYTLSLQLRHLK